MFTKKIIVVTIAKTDSNNITTYQTKSFPTFTKDLEECHDWLVDNNTLDVCMESTGKYWIPVFNVLETKCNCVITHPKYVRSIPGKKMIRKILNGFLICLNMDLLNLLLCHLPILDN